MFDKKIEQQKFNILLSKDGTLITTHKNHNDIKILTDNSENKSMSNTFNNKIIWNIISHFNIKYRDIVGNKIRRYVECHDDTIPTDRILMIIKKSESDDNIQNLLEQKYVIQNAMQQQIKKNL
jgi:hypothetical protein